MMQLGDTVKACSRCGLGQTSPNPFLTTLKNMRDIYTSALVRSDEYVPGLDLKKAARSPKSLPAARPRQRRSQSENVHLRSSMDGTWKAREGQTILEAADGAGVYIPRLCTIKDLPPAGTAASAP